MNKITKRNLRKLILALTLALTLTFGTGISVFADTTEEGAINGYDIKASSSIKATSASASTTFGSTGSVVVSSTYSYVNTETLATGTSSKNNGYYSSCSVSFSAPSNCRSVKITSTHTVSAYGQTWTASTSATY
ncbi:MAG: hypothetical protein HDR00_00750 [Lachnospiraceae bacterium]|nr:hypothetical protein [Lachnospiraceae bacterium]